MYKVAFRDCLANPVNLRGSEIHQYEKFSSRPCNHAEKQKQSSAGVDPGIRYTPTAGILEPPVALLTSRACIFGVCSLRPTYASYLSAISVSLPFSLPL